MTTQRWDALAAFVLAVDFVVAPMLCFLGDLRERIGVPAAVN